MFFWQVIRIFDFLSLSTDSRYLQSEPLKMLVFAFQSEIWIAENFNFSVFEVFCLSLSWKYRFSQNVNHGKVQSKTNKYCKFHFDLTRKGLSKSRFKKLGMVPKKLYRNTLKCTDRQIFKTTMKTNFLHGFSITGIVLLIVTAFFCPALRRVPLFLH